MHVLPFLPEIFIFTSLADAQGVDPDVLYPKTFGDLNGLLEISVSELSGGETMVHKPVHIFRREGQKIGVPSPAMAEGYVGS